MASGLTAFKVAAPSHDTGNRPPNPMLREQLRRLDWRFLLPTPELKRVFFAGPSRSSLLGALSASGCAVVTSRSAHLTGSSDRIAERFDVCVVQSTDEADVAQAARLLTPGGWLYWELSRRSPLMAPWRVFAPSRNTLQSLSSGRRFLARSGLSAIASSWHYPDFDSCRRIIPLEGRAGVRYFSRTAPALLRAVGEWLGASVIASALLPGVGSSVSFVAQKPFASVEDPS